MLRLLMTWMTVWLLVFITVSVYWFLAPIAYVLLDASDEITGGLSGEALEIYEFSKANTRYMYWVSCLVFVGAYLVWGFMSSQRRDYDSLGGY